ncbi:hypothetical protein PsYK624_137560 [Phanerochaete sordida]|uniref:Heterokaryon incompatibility domain-containing protein n=1 Tax=Phanerochaete sordida TaxID=48140 RepID=A0A9P3GLJ4_9APHY|nr:hypothetical protein PsYK624_137560 [Phanerochaete sordida]
MTTGLVTFQLREATIEVAEPPWEYAWDGVPISLSPFIDDRCFASPGLWYRTRGKTANRLHIWGVLQMARSGALPAEHVFATSHPDQQFTLTPEPRSSIPFQWVHVSARAIPNSLADMVCSEMPAQEVLAHLTRLLGLKFDLRDPNLLHAVGSVAGDQMDLGQLYGFLRKLKTADLKSSRVTGILEGKRKEDEAMRLDALQDGYINDAKMPPRRIWDLFSNRVLPFYIVPKDPEQTAPDVLTVSHSWAAGDTRQYVSTPINGSQWPVQIPQGTTLDQVRVELLNLGAEYIWLDVLCLRQRGRDEDEPLRKAEWRLDVPTIGYIYSCGRPCVTYFNGLGLPFNPASAALASERHWLRRVWTVQETTSKWIPGGMTGKASADAHAFFREHFAQAVGQDADGDYGRVFIENHARHGSVYVDTRALSTAVQAMRHRHCTTELDRVHTLAYVLNCRTLPAYEEDMAPEEAWAMLLKHLDPAARARVAYHHMKHTPESSSLLPSWSELLKFTEVITGSSQCFLSLVDKSSLASPAPGMYHGLSQALGRLALTRPTQDDQWQASVGLLGSSDNMGNALEPSNYQIYGNYRPETKYLILQFNRSAFAVAELVGKRDLGGETGRVLEVVKRGCLLFSQELRPFSLDGYPYIPVVYLTEEEVTPRA